ncbi:MAG: tRNA-dihydrouridine synthase family protein [Planctomycetota bacterium]
MLGVPLTLRAPSGAVALKSNLLLAPIAGWCDLAWRETCRSFGGVGLACTDLLSPKGLLCGSEASIDLARTSDLDRPIGMQLYGGDAAALAEGARWCADHGATVVDINMGCPVDKVCKKNGGSMLMCDVANTLRIFEAVREALPGGIPLTAKMRLGWDEDAYARDTAPELASGLCKLGAAMITVHGRTTEMRFKGDVRRDGIRRVVERVGETTGAYDGTLSGGVPVIGNGDVKTPGDVLSMLSDAGCAGVMIGRGAFAMPWVFRLAWEAQLAEREGREAADLEPTEDEKLDGVLAYFGRMRAYRSDGYAMHKIRQKISWLGRHINGSHCAPLKAAVRGAQTPGEVTEAVEAWRAGAPDRVQGRAPDTGDVLAAG